MPKIFTRSSKDDPFTLLSPHPIHPETEIETVWRKDNRIAVYSAESKSLHATFALPNDSERRPYCMTWTTLPEHPEHWLLVVLVHATLVCVWNVFPTDDIIDDEWRIFLPIECEALYALPRHGLLLPRMEYQGDEHEFVLQSPPHVQSDPVLPPKLPIFYAITHVMREVVPVGSAQSLLKDVQERIVWSGATSKDTVVVTHNGITKICTLYRLVVREKDEDEPMPLASNASSLWLEEQRALPTHSSPRYSRNDALADALGVGRKTPRPHFDPVVTHAHHRAAPLQAPFVLEAVSTVPCSAAPTYCCVDEDLLWTFLEGSDWQVVLPDQVNSSVSNVQSVCVLGEWLFCLEQGGIHNLYRGPELVCDVPNVEAAREWTIELDDVLAERMVQAVSSHDDLLACKIRTDVHRSNLSPIQATQDVLEALVYNRSSSYAAVQHVSAKNQTTRILPYVFDHLHMLYEELKLSADSRRCERLGSVLVRFCLLYPNRSDVTVRKFLEYYSIDLSISQLAMGVIQSIKQHDDPLSSLSLAKPVPCALDWFSDAIANNALNPFGFDYENMVKRFSGLDLLIQVTNAICRERSGDDMALANVLNDYGLDSFPDLHAILPPSMVLIVFETLWRYRQQINLSVPSCSPLWKLIGRDDLSANENLQSDCEQLKQSDQQHANKLDEKDDEDRDGLIGLERSAALLFPDDNRIHEATRMLRSSRPLYVRVDRAVETGDLDYERQKQAKLLLLVTRSFAQPIGRGMISYGNHESVPAQLHPIPELSLKGRMPLTNASISLEMEDCPADMRVWPEFHNGVAAGLRLSLDKAEANDFGLSRSWILFNQPTQSSGEETANARDALVHKNHSHAGMLLALGIRGHLTELEMSDLYEYLTQGCVTTTVGVLLGMAINKRGSCDMAISKMLCLHIPSLIPQHFSAIDVASSVQTAAVLGCGLLFMKSSHRMMTEFLLNEIGKRPDSDTGAFERESYNLVCGIALGMVNLCLAQPSSDVDRAAALADLRVSDRLQKYVVGGVDHEEETRVRESNDRFSLPSIQLVGESEKCSTIYEGDRLNTDVTGPGATLALGLIYMQSGNEAIAAALALPETHFTLEFVRPDLLSLRIISRSLVMWDTVTPSVEWVESQIPAAVNDAYIQMKETARAAACGQNKKNRHRLNFDRRAVRQIYVHCVSGACFSLGLRYAGTANEKAKEVLKFFALELYALRESNDAVAMAVKPELPILETTLGTVAIALAMVMAGTGDLDLLRIFKMLRWRCDDKNMFGFHMSCGMATGMLFLGGGTCTIGNEPEDIAAVLTAFFPRFPLTTSDNQCHLQALRHLYALAVRKQVLRAIDVETNETVQVSVELFDEDDSETVALPCLIRNSDSRERKLKLLSNDHYPLVVPLDTVLRKGIVHVQRRKVLPATTRDFFPEPMVKIPTKQFQPEIIQLLLSLQGDLHNLRVLRKVLDEASPYRFWLDYLHETAERSIEDDNQGMKLFSLE